MLLTLFALLLLLAGTACLLLALPPTKTICDLESTHRLAWRWLGAFILLFLAGYLYYILSPPDPGPAHLQDLLLSLILCGGGVFVILVVRLSLQTLNSIKRIADDERYRALHDELTELPNRNLLYERIEQAMLQAQREKAPIAVLLMDLNRFKEINDTLGHFYGDYLLQMIAPRLRQSIRKSDTIARFGGDEFAVVLPGVELEQAITIAEKIGESMEQPFQIEGNQLSVDVSIGIALYPEHGDGQRHPAAAGGRRPVCGQEGQQLLLCRVQCRPGRPQHGQADADRGIAGGDQKGADAPALSAQVLICRAEGLRGRGPGPLAQGRERGAYPARCVHPRCREIRPDPDHDLPDFRQGFCPGCGLVRPGPAAARCHQPLDQAAARC